MVARSSKAQVVQDFKQRLACTNMRLARIEHHFKTNNYSVVLFRDLDKRLTACFSLFGHVCSVAGRYQSRDATKLVRLLLRNIGVFLDAIDRELDSITKAIQPMAPQ